MTAHVFFTPAEMEAAAVQGSTAVVIDAIRATTTIVEAFAHGATRIFPASPAAFAS